MNGRRTQNHNISTRGTTKRAASAPSDAFMLVETGKADALADAEAVRLEDATLVTSPIELATVRDRTDAAAVTTSAPGDGDSVE